MIRFILLSGEFIQWIYNLPWDLFIQRAYYVCDAKKSRKQINN